MLSINSQLLMTRSEKLLEFLKDYPNFIARKCQENKSKDNDVLKTLVDGKNANSSEIYNFKKYVLQVVEKNLPEITELVRKIKLLINILKDNSIFEDGAIPDIEYVLESQLDKLKKDYLITTIEPNPNKRIQEEVYFVLFSKENIEELIKSVRENLNELVNRHRNSILLSELFNSNTKCLIVGKNGSGKSTLVENLKQDRLKRTLVLPARKNLMFYSDVEEINQPELLLEKNQSFSLKSSETQLFEDLSYRHFFSNLIRTLVAEEHYSKINGKISKLEQINAVFKKIFPEFLFVSEPYKRKILVSKNQSDFYEINNLSDGEKSIFFYIANIVLAKEKTVIVVDEPETHLHPSICSKLWDELVMERRDCYFIFISHDINFIASRSDATISWCRQYSNSFKYDIVTNINEESITRDIFVSLLGSSKPILFCEGNLESLDYKLFNILYSDKYTIKPVENHLKVIEYTKIINNSDLKIGNSQAIGIIDRDFKDEEQLEEYKKDQIFCLPVNEIEMLFMYPEIIKSVISWRDDWQNLLESILTAASEMMRLDKNIELMSTEYCNYKLSQVINLNKAKTEFDLLRNKASIIDEVEKISNMYSRRKEFLTNIFASNQWEDKLKYCSLKRKITKEIMNKFESEYVDRALSQIRNTTEIKSFLKQRIALPIE
ncbi:TPA: AAA family ATPase [Streptococcus suis]